MADTRSASDKSGARARAQNHFAASEQRENAVRQMIENERAAVAARTDRLRKLRLAKEEADRVAAANAPPPAPKSSKPRMRKSVAKKSS
jgi:hypothetical protein